MSTKLLSAASAAAISVGFLVFSAGTAQAAPAHDWSGFYVGAHLYAEQAQPEVGAFSETLNQYTGASIRNTGGTNTVFVIPATTFAYAGDTDTTTALFGGAQVGYNFASSDWVFGVEADVDSATQDADVTQTFSAPATLLTPQSTFAVRRSMNLEWRWSARLKVGYVWENTLIYATAGIAGAQVNIEGQDTFTSAGGAAATPGGGACCTVVNTTPVTNYVTGATGDRRNGWTAGVGAEWGLSENVSLAVEFRHTDLGEEVYSLPTNAVVAQVPTVTTPLGSPGGGTAPNGTLSATPISFKSDAVGMRLNFRF